MTPVALSGLDLLATAVVVVDARLAVRYMNPSAENLFELSSRNVAGQLLNELFTETTVLEAAIDYARTNNCSYTEHDLELDVNGRARLHLSCTVTPIEFSGDPRKEELLLEFRHIEQQLRIAREERLLDQSQANRELIRNLAHEIKNPLGGIRGAAQLLDRELERPNLHEYTQVIMKEADRLQLLMDRLLTPHRLPQPSRLNMHEVLERVRSLILAEYPRDIAIHRDYDVSLPLLKGDREQLIQAVLNIVQRGAGRHRRRCAGGNQAAHPRRAAGDAGAPPLPPRARGRSHRQWPRHTAGTPGAHLPSAGFRPRRRQRPGAHARAELRQPAPRDDLFRKRAGQHHLHDTSARRRIRKQGIGNGK